MPLQDLGWGKSEALEQAADLWDLALLHAVRPVSLGRISSCAASLCFMPPVQATWGTLFGQTQGESTVACRLLAQHLGRLTDE